MVAAYGVISLVSLLLIGVCLMVDRQRDIWLLCLFVSVFVSNLGYFLISVSKTLDFALMANRIAYAGCVFLPFFMLMMVLNLCGIKYQRWLPPALCGVNFVVLLVAASPGFLPIYYKNVSIETVDGATKLVREYGSLHHIYSIYLFAYFAAMVAIVIYAIKKRKITGVMHAAFLLCAVFGNIVIWIVEKFIPRNFEFLSVSYVSTEVFILLLYGILQEYSLLNQGVPDAAAVVIPAARRSVVADTAQINENNLFTAEEIERMIANCEEISPLTNRERDVLRLMLENKKRKDMSQELFVTESTIKKYTSQIYRKLSVTNRIELFAKLKDYK
ncbi:MAG: hypothetical protein J6L81_09690 [Clostridia bacterium]|nr:hypothetical protein [Clostridia bacterium]